MQRAYHHSRRAMTIWTPLYPIKIGFKSLKMVLLEIIRRLDRYQSDRQSMWERGLPAKPVASAQIRAEWTDLFAGKPRSNRQLISVRTLNPPAHSIPSTRYRQRTPRFVGW